VSTFEVPPSGGLTRLRQDRTRAFVIAFLSCLLLPLAGCRNDATPPKPESKSAEAIKVKRELRIAAAADLKFALIDLVTAFEKRHPDATIIVTARVVGQFLRATLE